jgi:hypothetical protein
MSGVVYETGGHGFERRIGARTPMEIEVAWVDPSAGGNRAGRQWTGRIENASVTGAVVTGPADLPIGVGEGACLRYEGADSQVVIRRREATEVAHVARYGVELTRLDPTLKRRLYEAAAPEQASTQLWDLTS